MAMSGPKEDGGPMMEINTTPLIDVMLVLLIMIIMTIPVQTHAVKVDLPVQDKNTPPPPTEVSKNVVYIDPNGTIYWNATPVQPVQLQQYLEQTKSLPVEPELHFQPDPQARYEVVDFVLSIIKRSNITKLGFVGNERYANDF
ncbi:ExbD/TolR family protein [Sphingomonas canadensis]|uniref:ExbD/TolR family protein n=1 Tax=Sphingomonas canadensis TaxID=1219257 RepID=A0ABW3HFF9_9SPHN|nr:biopolymer transporter ExbD [Sphingomonas canadensis]MCW3838035.1 biopolymer transporter ExbD [Sphingomonas canadensis]